MTTTPTRTVQERCTSDVVPEADGGGDRSQGDRLDNDPERSGHAHPDPSRSRHRSGPGRSSGRVENDAAEVAARLRLSATRLARRLRQEADTGALPQPAVGARHHRQPRPAHARRAGRARAGRTADDHQGRHQARSATASSHAIAGPRRPPGEPRPTTPSGCASSSTRAAGARPRGSPTASLELARRRAARRLAAALDVLEQLIAVDQQEPSMTRLRGVAAGTRSARCTSATSGCSSAASSSRRSATGSPSSRRRCSSCKLTDSGIALGLLAALPVRSGPALRRVGRPGRRPLRQAQAAADRADVRDGAVVRAGRPRLHAHTRRCSPIYARRHVRRRRHRLRQPGPPGVRRRDGARGPTSERGQPEQRADDRLARRRPGARPACSSSPSASAGAFAVDGLSYLRRARRPLADATRPSCAAAPVTPRGKGQVREGLRYVRQRRPSSGCRW